MIYGTLRVTTPDGQVREYPLEQSDTVMGRSQGVGITVDHVSVSRRHAHLRVEGGRLVVQDLGSASGTFVGGQRIEPQQSHSVSPGQMIRFGDCEAIYIGSDFEPAPAPPPVVVPEPIPEPVAPPTPTVAATPPAAAATPASDADATVLAQPALGSNAPAPPTTPAATTNGPGSQTPPPAPVTPSAPPASPSPPPAAPVAAAAPSTPAASTSPSPAPTPAVPAPPPAPPPTPRQQERPSTIAVSLASPTAPVAAGGTTTATIVVQNRGPVVDQVSLSVPDLDQSWVQVRRTNLSLVPGARDEVTIVLKPPKHSSATAGEHQFAVAAVSAEQGNEVRVLGKFNILPFEQFEIAARARNSKGKTAVTVRNLGNAPATRTIVPGDDEDALNYTVDEEQVELGPGEEKVVNVQVKAKKRNPFGKNKFYRFRVEARPKSGAGQAVQAPGSYAYRAPLRHWRYMLLGMLLAGLVGGGYWLWSTDRIPFFGGSSDPDPTPGPTATIAPGETPTTPVADTPTVPVEATITVDGDVRIINSPENSRLNVRPEPDRTAQSLARLLNGETASVLEGPTDAGGFRWWKIRTAGGVEGWAAEMLITGSGTPEDIGPWMEPAE